MKSRNISFLRLRNPQTNKIPDGIREREHDFVEELARRNAAALWSAPVADTVLKPDVAQLQQHGIERTGGRTRSIVIDCTNEKILLAGAVGGGVWRSTDGGANWKKTTSDGAKMRDERVTVGARILESARQNVDMSRRGDTR